MLWHPMRDLLRFLNYIIQVPLSCDYAVNSFLMSLPHTLLNPTRTMYNTSVTWHTRSFIFKFWILIRIIFINLDMYWGIYTRYDWSTCESKQILMKWAIYILKCLVILKLLIFNLHISSQNQMANYEEI